MTDWYLKNFETDSELQVGAAEYVVRVQGERDVKAEFAIAAKHFKDAWFDDMRRLVIGRVPSTEALHRIAAATDRTPDEMAWLDWARRNPMEAREVLDLPRIERRGKHLQDPPTGSGWDEPTWWPQAASEYGVPMTHREYIIEKNDNYREEIFGFADDGDAASVHFSHWEIRVDAEFFHHVVARGPVSHTAKMMCKRADRARGHTMKGDKNELITQLECLDMIEKRPGGFRLTKNARTLMKAFEDTGVFCPGEAKSAFEGFVENEL